ncbi:MAG: Glu-tRNA(Gln) amidotransferase subunit GatE [Candidatus Woesearchaeota archaeon]
MIQYDNLDYEKLGFKAGLEIHQELNTKKLFCNCESKLEEKDLICEIKRKIRASAGEIGEIDAASLYEQLRDRTFIYHGYKKEVCLVDLDEEPPHMINEDAFEIALQAAKIFKLDVPDTICTMRKTVSDGSSVSGFQRTILIGSESENSYLETSKGKVKIVQLNLEEDSCKIEKKENINEKNIVYYSLSRQGIPLLEIGTDASLKDPEHVKEVALEIGTILRSLNVKRGLGTIRQDVNISIKDGTRIEVKGWQDLKKLDLLVKNEVLRQYNLIEIKKELEKRGLKKFEKFEKEVTNIFEKTEFRVISDLIKNNGKVFALLLPKFSGLLKREICIGKTFGKELSEYAKAYGTKGMIHSDEDLIKYKLEKEFIELRKLFNANEDDLILIVAEKEEICKKAINSVYERALYCLKGVPNETRVPNHNDATSSYARPLPGSHRMYPETDIPYIKITKEIIENIKIPELLKDKIERYHNSYGIDKSMAKELIREYDFDYFVSKYKHIDPKFLAFALLDYPKEIRKRFGKELEIENNLDKIEKVLEKLNNNEISKDAVFEIFVEICENKEIDFLKYKKMDENELRKEISEIITQNKGLNYNAMIGKVMAKLKGKADGKKIVEIIKEIMNE